MTKNTVQLHRVLQAPPERVYNAFTNADAKAKWLPPYGFTGHVHHHDATVGGKYAMSFTNLSNGQSHGWTGEYVELTPNERIVYKDKFDSEFLPGQMETTITLKAVPTGTELTVVQAGIPDAIPLDGCHLGWQQSLTQLAWLVEANIPG